jgi:putative toxin-antitoxin system antitoxin component (TIGR02293 family)
MPVRDTLSTRRARELKRSAGKSPHRDVRAVKRSSTWSSTWFVRVFSMPATERVEVAKRGVPAVFISHLAKATGEPKEHVIALLGLSRATVDRKTRAKQALSVVESERVIGFAKLVGQVQAIVNESGDPAGFDAAKWVAGWLERPMPALDGRTPGEYMDTAEGQQIVAGLLERARSGAFA